MNATSLPMAQQGGDRAQAASIALWFFIGVACSLFGLFFAAYVMRLESAQGFPLDLPWQFMLSTALLVVASLALQFGGGNGRGALLMAGLCGLGFVLVQLWAWAALAAEQVLPAGNPAASFLYLLTAMHGLHVLGGLGGWLIAWRGGEAWRLRLCARYWHFLLLLWLGLYAVLALVTPEIAQLICGTSRS
jgi:cytochrome c oxidase subunit 3